MDRERARPTDRLGIVAMRMGVLVPVLYFGIQLVAAPFFPDYSFVRQAASELGSDRSSQPGVFNTGAVLMGIAALMTAFGFVIGFQRLRAHPVLVWITTLALIAVGLSSLWAGVFPMPDPRHGANPFAIGLFVLPLCLLATTWKLRDATALRTYLSANLVLLIGLMLVRALGLDVRSFEGVFQRVLALVVFVPVGVVGWFLAAKVTTFSPGHSTG